MPQLELPYRSPAPPKHVVGGKRHASSAWTVRKNHVLARSVRHVALFWNASSSPPLLLVAAVCERRAGEKKKYIQCGMRQHMAGMGADTQVTVQRMEQRGTGKAQGETLRGGTPWRGLAGQVQVITALEVIDA